jgi:hypothetical protein
MLKDLSKFQKGVIVALSIVLMTSVGIIITLLIVLKVAEGRL